MSPVVSTNAPLMFKKDTVGKLFPSIEYKLEDIPGLESGKRLHLRDLL